MTSYEQQNEETAWLYYLPQMTAQELEAEEREQERSNLEAEADASSSDNESFSDLPSRPGPLRLADLFDEVADDDDNDMDDDDFIPFTRAYLSVKYIPFDPGEPNKSNSKNEENKEESENEGETKYCVICFETREKKDFVYFKEEWMVGNKCCVQNHMCEDCFINTVRHAPNQTVCCPFCRHPISHVETHNPGLNKKINECS